MSRREQPPDWAVALASEIRALRTQLAALNGRGGCLLREAGWSADDALDARELVDDKR